MNYLKLLVLTSILVLAACKDGGAKAVPVSDSGVKKVSVQIVVGSDGKTVEQRNVAERVDRDNSIGNFKHLYIISAYSGDVIIYSTVRGKVTSSGKRLTSTQALVRGDRGEWTGDFVMQAIQDDGTYGSSVPYIYWFDSKGVYHQHYVTGGQIVHVTDAPMVVGKVILNFENSTAQD